MKSKVKIFRALILVGMLSPLSYIVAYIVGGISNEGYNHINHSVSDLLVEGMKQLFLIDSLMLMSSIATIVGCMAIYICYKSKSTFRLRVGIIMLGLSGFSNIMSSYVFRLEESDNGMTASTILHITFVACSALFVIIGALLVAWSVNKVFQWKGVKVYTIVSLGILTLGGMIIPIVINSGIEMVGLLERTSIMAYHQWFIFMIYEFYSSYENSIAAGT